MHSASLTLFLIRWQVETGGATCLSPLEPQYVFIYLFMYNIYIYIYIIGILCYIKGVCVCVCVQYMYINKYVCVCARMAVKDRQSKTFLQQKGDGGD